MARCLVTGGAGFIGSHLVERLLELGHEVRILDDLSTGVRANLDRIASHPKCELRVGSITDPVVLAEVVHGVDVIYHLAAAVGVKLVADDPVRTIETNIYPTEVLLRLERTRRNAGPRRTICFSARPRVRAGRTAAPRRSTNSWRWPTTASTTSKPSSDGSSTSSVRGKSAITEW
jgi:nucleoside-diphosphate-sugar epimerase